MHKFLLPLLLFTTSSFGADSIVRYLNCDQGKHSFEKTIFPHLTSNCIKCHSQGPGPKFLFKDVGETYEIILEKTQFDAHERSKFHTKGGDGHCKDYGHDCKTDEKIIGDLISKWWSGGQNNCEKKTWHRMAAKPLNPESTRKVEFAVGENGATLSVDVKVKPQNPEIPYPLYVLSNVKLQAGTKAMKLSGVQFSINGKTFGYPDAFESIRAVISANSSQLLSSSRVTIPKLKKGEDEITLSIETLEEKESFNKGCHHSDLFVKNVFPLMDYRCTFCHGVKSKGGKASAKAQAVFLIPMGTDITDQQLNDLCERSLERTQTQNLLESPLFRLALGGDPNHERVYSLLDTSIPKRVKKVYPDWAEWAEAERDHVEKPKELK